MTPSLLGLVAFKPLVFDAIKPSVEMKAPLPSIID